MTYRVQEYCVCITGTPGFPSVLCAVPFCQESEAGTMKQRFRQLALISCYLKDDTTRSVLINWSGHQTKHAQKAEPDSVIDEQIYYIRLQRGRGSKHITWYAEQNCRDTWCVAAACTVWKTNTNTKPHNTFLQLIIKVQLQQSVCASINTVCTCVMIIITAI